jgi:hypothetical protein
LFVGNQQGRVTNQHAPFAFMEMWKPIAQLDNVYSVSSHGRIRSNARRVSTGLGRYRGVGERIMKTCISKKGYVILVANFYGKQRSVQVHQAVAIAFISNPINKPSVNHKNGDKTDNHAENLEWVTVYENNYHAAHILKKGVWARNLLKTGCINL